MKKKQEKNGKKEKGGFGKGGCLKKPWLRFRREVTKEGKWEKKFKSERK